MLASTASRAPTPCIIDVPDNGNCLYDAAMLGALLPQVPHQAEFVRVACQLFGEEDLDTWLSPLKSAMGRFNGQWDSICIPALPGLMLRFRKRVVHYIEEHILEYFPDYQAEQIALGRLDSEITEIGFRGYLTRQKMNHTWGGGLEISAMQRLLSIGIDVFRWFGVSDLTVYASRRGDLAESICLILTGIRDSENHYHVMLDPSLVRTEYSVAATSRGTTAGDFDLLAEGAASCAAMNEASLLADIKEQLRDPSIVEIRAFRANFKMSALGEKEIVAILSSRNISITGISKYCDALSKINALKRVFAKDKRTVQEDADRARSALMRGFEALSSPGMLMATLLGVSKAEEKLEKSIYTADLSERAIDDKMLVELVIPILMARRDVRALNLSQCMLTAECIPAITELLRRNRGIISVNLSQNLIYSALGRELAPLIELIKSGHPVVVDLVHNYLTETVVKNLNDMRFEEDLEGLLASARSSSLGRGWFNVDGRLPNGKKFTNSHVEEEDYITEENGYVYMARDDRADRDRSHVLLYLQGSNGHGQIFFERTHLQKTIAGVAGVFSALLHGTVVVEPSINPARNLQSLRENFKYKRWSVSQDVLMKLRKAIHKEEGTRIPWEYCLGWVKGHLARIEKKFEKDFRDLFPEHLLQDQERMDKECAIL